MVPCPAISYMCVYIVLFLLHAFDKRADEKVESSCFERRALDVKYWKR